MDLQKPTIVLLDMDGTTVRHKNPKLLVVLDILDWWSHQVGVVRDVLIFWRKRRKADTTKFLHQIMHKLRRAPAHDVVEPAPGVEDFLKTLQADGVRVALVSNGLGHGYGKDVLAHYGLERYFGAAIFREDFKNAKPDPDPLHRALAKLGVLDADAGTIWVVGDRAKDIEAARGLALLITARVTPIAFGLKNSAAKANTGGVCVEDFEQLLALYRGLERNII